jgi:diacylglycerol kinase family enzyme
MRVTLIHNPDAGDDDQPAGDKLIRLIRSMGHEVVYRSSKGNDWDNALKEPTDVVVAAGGDGLVGKIAKRLAGRRTPIAVLPIGTANNVAKTLGLADKALEDLITGWTSARRKKFDVGVATGPWGSTCLIEGLGIGLFTETMDCLHATNKIDLAHASNADEEITSVLEILKDRLQRCPVKTLKLVLDDQDLSGEYVLMEVMNIRCVGPNLCLAPDADPGDGLLDVVLVSKREEHRLNRYLSDCIAGRPSSPELMVYRGRHMQIEWEGSMIHLDDKVWPDDGSPVPPSPATIEVDLDRGSLQFLVAPDA